MVVTRRSTRSINASTASATTDVNSGTPNLSKKEILARARAKAAAWSESRKKESPTETHVRYEESDGEDDGILPSSVEMRPTAKNQNEKSSDHQKRTPLSKKERLELARAKARQWAEEELKRDEGARPVRKPDDSLPENQQIKEEFYSPDPFIKTQNSPREEAPAPSELRENLPENMEPASPLTRSSMKGVGMILIPTAIVITVVLLHLGILPWSTVQNKILDSPEWNAILQIIEKMKQ